jgi:hypothetical protein
MLPEAYARLAWPVHFELLQKKKGGHMAAF